MNAVVKRWVIGICVEMCIPATLYITRNYLHRNDKYARVAAIVGVDVNTWADVVKVYDKSTQMRTLSDRDLDKEQAWITHPKVLIRLRALTGLSYCSDSAVRPRAIILMRKSLEDVEPMMRVKAIAALRYANDPDLRADVGKLSHDPEKYVREAAGTALHASVAEGKAPR